MALSQTCERTDPFNRSRSSSLTSPVAKRFVYQEVFDTGENTLVRSYSCDQFFKKRRSGEIVTATRLRVANFVTPTRHLSKLGHCRLHDVAEHRPARKALTFNEAPGRKTTSETKYTNSLLVLVSWKFYAKIVLFPAYILLLCMAVQYLIAPNCNEPLDIVKIHKDLEKSVFGQNEAILKISELLTNEEQGMQPLVVMLTGGVGVGKTLTSSIISQNLPPAVSSHILFGNSINSVQPLEVLSNSWLCDRYLIVVDDITSTNMLHVFEFTKALIKYGVQSRSGQHRLILILNCQTNSLQESSTVSDLFKKAHSNLIHISLQLSPSDIQLCFMTELSKLNMSIDANVLNELIPSYSRDEELGGGCKKVRDLLISFSKLNNRTTIS